MPDDPQLVNPMDYLPPTDENREQLKVLAFGLKAAYENILAHCPQSPERTLAVRKLQEARMWANLSIVLNGKRYLT